MNQINILRFDTRGALASRVQRLCWRSVSGSFTTDPLIQYPRTRGRESRFRT